jgi:HSP20 family protein
VCAQRWQELKEPFGIEDALERLLEEMAAPREEGASTRVNVLPEGLVPHVDVERSTGHYRIVVEVPGVDPSGLRVTAGPHTVIIEGAWRPRAAGEARETLLQETRRGAFRRVVELPGPADGREARAVLENGILEITLPLAEENNGEEISVDVG